MSKVLQLKRGNTAKNNAYTGAVAELTVDTEAKTLRLHDGSTAGGVIIAPGGEANVIEKIQLNGVDQTVTSKTVNLSVQTPLSSTNKVSSMFIDDTVGGNQNTHKFVTQSDITNWNGKQEALVSGTNIKTVNNNSLLGSGNISIDSLPSQTGQSGKFLTTDGTDASWSDAPYTQDNLIAGNNVNFRNIVEGIDSHVLALMHFDNNLDDVSQYKNTRQFIGGNYTGLTFNDGKFDKCIRAWSNGRIKYSNSGWPSAGEVFTIDCWARGGVSEYRTPCIVSNADDEIALTIYISSYSSCQCGAIENNNTTHFPDVNTFRDYVNFSGWNHFALQYNTTTKKAEFFCNGHLCATLSGFNSNFSGGLKSYEIRSGTTWSSDCYLDELRISDVARFSDNYTIPTVPYGQSTGQTAVDCTLDISGKQDTLVSGTNIKTVNNTSLLGSGNISIAGLPSQTGQSGKFLTTDGTDASWGSVPAPAGVYTKDNLVGGTNISITEETIAGIGTDTLACFHFNGDLTDSSLYASSGSGNTGITATYTDNGKFGKALQQFTSGTIEYTNNAFGAANSLTLDFWYYLSTNFSMSSSVTIYPNTSDSIECKAYYYNGVKYMYVYNGSKAIVDAQCSSLLVNDWNHLAFVITAGTLYTYVNGTLFNQTTTNVPVISSIRQIVVSKSDNVYYLDEVRLCNSVKYTANFTPETEQYSTQGITISKINNTQSAPSVMTGATSGAAGTSGLVPAPAAGDNTKYLRGDGTWVLPFVAVTQAQYDALVIGGTVDSNTLYVIIPAS